MKILKIPFLFVIGITLINSCKKENEPTAVDFLTSGIWHIVEHQVDYNNDGDLIDEDDNALTDCEIDNLYIFNSGGEFIIDYGANICGPTQQRDTGTWLLLENGNFLSYSIVNNTDTVRVHELTNIKMELHEIEDEITKAIIIFEK
ncbi:MAG: hypothetical protein R2830_10300 [Saprospiraceae bacterium]